MIPQVIPLTGENLSLPIQINKKGTDAASFTVSQSAGWYGLTGGDIDIFFTPQTPKLSFSATLEFVSGSVIKTITLTGTLKDYFTATTSVSKPVFVKYQIKGDANDDGVVDIDDVNITVDYITGKNPSGLVFNLADVDGSGIINIYDVVGIIDMIRNPQGSAPAGDTGTAYFALESQLVIVFSDKSAIGGFDISLKDESAANAQILSALNGFEIVKYMKDGTLHVMVYSTEGKFLNAQRIYVLMSILSEDASIVEIEACTPQGYPLKVNNSTTGINLPKTNYFSGIYPVPVKDEAIIKFVVSEEVNKVVLSIYNATGNLIESKEYQSLAAGENEIIWQRKGYSTGIYYCILEGYSEKKSVFRNVVRFIVE